MGWFKKKFDLESAVRDAILQEGVEIVDSHPGPGYLSQDISGMGDSAKDNYGALSRFVENFKRLGPEKVSDLRVYIDDLQIGLKRDPRKKVTAVGYFPKPSAA